jgi:hypothetical protein
VQPLVTDLGVALTKIAGQAIAYPGDGTGTFGAVDDEDTRASF